MSQRNIFLHLHKNGLIEDGHEPINDFTKPISRREFDILTNKNKKKYNRFATANNIPVYEKTKKE